MSILAADVELLDTPTESFAEDLLVAFGMKRVSRKRNITVETLIEAVGDSEVVENWKRRKHVRGSTAYHTLYDILELNEPGMKEERFIAQGVLDNYLLNNGFFRRGVKLHYDPTKDEYKQ